MRTPRLRIAPTSISGIGANPKHLLRTEGEPVPLMRFDIEQETPDGPKVDSVILWRNEDATRCNWCPGACNFIPGPEGQGVCTVRRPAARNRLDPPSLLGGG